MAAKDVTWWRSARRRIAHAPSNATLVPARPGDAPAWRQRLRGARNIISLVLLAAVFTWRSSVSWRRWRRRHPGR